MVDPEIPSASDSPTTPTPAETVRPDQGDGTATPQEGRVDIPQQTTAIQEEGRVEIPQRITAITGETPATTADKKKEPHKPSPEILARRVRVLDRVLVGLVLVLAFFLGSFTIGNSDFWMHLATGRLL